MRAFASPTFRLAAGLAGPVLALAMAAPAQSADVIYERHSEYERYGEPPPPVYAPPVNTFTAIRMGIRRVHRRGVRRVHRRRRVAARHIGRRRVAVSYTHLTLPTKA